VDKKKRGTKHISFEEGLLGLSARAGHPMPTLTQVQGLWEVTQFNKTSPSGVCQLCGKSRLKRSATIARIDLPDVRQVVGQDCAQKLNVFNQTGRIEALDDRLKAHKRRMLDWMHNELRQLGHKTASTLRWWLEEQDQQSLPAPVRTALMWLRKPGGYVPSIEHGLALVEYFKSYRPFAIDEVLVGEEWALYKWYGAYLNLPAQITLNQLPEIRAQLHVAEKDCTLNWQRIAARLVKGIPSSEFGAVELRYGVLSLSLSRFKIDVVCPPGVLLGSMSVEHLQLTIPKRLRSGTVLTFDPKRQHATVELSQELAETWFSQAEQLQQAAQLLARQQAEMEAVRQETARRQRLIALLAGPIRLEDADLQVHVIDATTVGLYWYAEGARIETTISNATAHADFYPLTKPDELSGFRSSTSELYHTAELVLPVDVMVDWNQRASALREQSLVRNRAVLKQRIEEELERGRLRHLQFSLEHNLKLGCTEWVARNGRHRYRLSFDDSYRPEEGSVLVWVGGKFHPKSASVKVHRVQEREQPDGALQLVYRFKPARSIDVIFVQVVTVR